MRALIEKTNMSLLRINAKYLNQTHLLRQAIMICAEGQCNEHDILHRLSIFRIRPTTPPPLPPLAILIRETRMHAT